MDKSQLIEILQACLLSYEGVGGKQLEEQGLRSSNVRVGINLNNYLRSKL